jgi:cytochrome c oxidase subunit 4
MSREHGIRTYLLVWASLVALLAITVAVSYVHFGRLNAVIALAIAVIKATLIALFFMHLRSSAKLIWLVTAASVVWLAIMFALTVSDYETRRFLPAPAVWQK